MRTRATYNAASKQKQRGQRIDRQSDDSADGGYEGANEAYYGGHHAEDAGENFVVRHRWRAAVMLCGDEVGRESEDNEAAEKLEQVGQSAGARIQGFEWGPTSKPRRAMLAIDDMMMGMVGVAI